MREHDKMLAVGIGLIADTVYNKMIDVCMKDNVLSAETMCSLWERTMMRG